ncbi:site-specific DNA-methyltransferase [Myroides marinus]|uniref:DNA-methyltransferase n=1 Tax=Myroides marinus TaxID=703342 RepID=UPI00257659B4|nr:site-specific DNA-methyltransferase [Myroides marinus]MDM1352078.1 site-specific DNA-methyltransferase [Myroides marinus]MDM1359236.1 site-specific DNA-methyltransferase [Myroides marinus]
MKNYFNKKYKENNVFNTSYINGDCIEVMATMDENSVNTIVTSPPYNLNKKYGKYNDNRPLDEWEALIDKVAVEAKRVLTHNGSFFLNVSPIPDKKTKEIIPLDAIAYFIFKRHGFYLRNSIVWHFNNMQNCTNRLSGRWESILWFVKDINNYVFNLDDIRIPFITKNDKRLVGKTGRNPTDTWSFDLPESDFWYFDRVNNMTKGKLGISEHPCIFPTPMIERIIKMSTNEGDVVLDPFLGSGTTLIAAQKLNRIGLGIELDEKFNEIIDKRILNESSPELF